MVDTCLSSFFISLNYLNTYFHFLQAVLIYSQQLTHPSTQWLSGLDVSSLCAGLCQGQCHLLPSLTEERLAQKEGKTLCKQVASGIPFLTTEIDSPCSLLQKLQSNFNYLLPTLNPAGNWPLS